MTVAGRTSYNTRLWKVHLRKLCYERDGYRCRKCGAVGKQKGGTATLSMDHLVPERLWPKGKTPRLQDVVTLCLSCHGKKDGGRRYTAHTHR